MLVSNGHVQLECSIFSPQRFPTLHKAWGEERRGLENVRAGRGGDEKSASPPSVPSLQARHLSDGFSQGLHGAPLSKASALALCIPCLLSVWSLLVGVVLQGGGIVVRQCEVPFQRGLPDWDLVATLPPPSLLSWSCFVLSLIPPQGCLLWCQLPHLPGGPEEKDQPFPLVLPSR